MHVLHEEKRNGKTIQIGYDEFANMDSPRDWDNLGTLAGYMRRQEPYDHALAGSGDLEEDFLRHIFEDVEQRDGYFDDLTEKQLNRFANSVKRRYVFFPYSAYTKGGCILRRGVASGWDCGLVGISYVSREKMRAEGIRTYKLAEKIMEGELETFSAWCNGEVYDYHVLEDEDVVDSCGGFYSEEEALAEARMCCK